MKAGFTGFKKKKRPRKKSQHCKATDHGERMKNRLLDCSWGAEANDREWSGPPTPVRLVPFMKWLRPRGFLFLFDRSRLPCTWVCCSESHARRKQQETTTTLSVKAKSDRGSRRIQRGPKPLMWSLTDVSGSFLPPLFRQFLPLLWAHRICWEKDRTVIWSFILDLQ